MKKVIVKLVNMSLNVGEIFLDTLYDNIHLDYTPLDHRKLRHYTVR